MGSLTTGCASWRIVGRPPATILKKKQVKDAAKELKFKDRERRGRKRNIGSGLTWTEAKTHWIRWFQNNKARNIHRVLQSDSPKQKDVMADFEHRSRMTLKWRRGARARAGHASGSTARMGPDGTAHRTGNWARTGPGHSAQ